MLWLAIARAYALVVWFVAKKLDIWLPGLGFLCRRVSLGHVIAMGDRKYFFHRPAASMYSTLLVGRSLEPETHALFARVVPRVAEPIGFVDVGAAVGEMVIDVAGYPNVARVVAFDPDPDNAAACRLSAGVNGFRNVEVREKVVADAARVVHFQMNRGRGRSGAIRAGAGATTEELRSTTLDLELVGWDLPTILLVDVEGAEPLVLRGAARFLAAVRPLVVFEYITGRDRHLDEIRSLLGADYAVHRLRPDGFLDEDFRRTWNCVAVPRRSPFEAPCRALVRPPSR